MKAHLVLQIALEVLPHLVSLGKRLVEIVNDAADDLSNEDAEVAKQRVKEARAEINDAFEKTDARLSEAAAR